MSKTIILPACDDGNRGDQALVWQTHELAKSAGLADECKMLTDQLEDSPQSIAEGIGVLQPILRHPNTKFSPKSNLSYGKLLFITWGVISLLDGLKSFLLLFRPTRAVVYPFLNRGEQHTINEIRSADACFVKGGGFIHTTNSISDPYKAYYFLYHVLLAQSLKTSVYVMPNSFGPLNGALYQFIVRKALTRCKLVTARESISQDMLEAIGIRSDLYPDLAFSLRSEETESTFFESLRERVEGRPLVGITARPYRFPGASDPKAAYERYINEMSKFTTVLYENGYFPVFVEHVVSAGEHESDIAAISAIVENLDTAKFAVFSNPSLTAREIKAIYGQCDYVVGTRFHSVIFALSEGTPALAIGYGGNKGRGIMRDIGLPENVVSIESFTANIAYEKFCSLSSQQRAKEGLEKLNQKIAIRHSQLLTAIEKSL